MQFKDHFSGHAERYAQYRPAYPDRLYDEIYRYVQRYGTAWDVGTGNGQVAVKLAGRFDRVMASDASARQIEFAEQHPKVEYHVCKAEHTLFEDAAFDLVTVGQALHWFEFGRFFREVTRVTRPNGIFACWTYRFLTVNREVDAVLERFFHLIEPYWPPERDHVEARYTTIPFPENFQELEVPQVHIERPMRPDAVLGYLDTWSSVKNYKEQKGGQQPTELIREDLLAAWGGAETEQLVRHPMVLRVFSVGRKG